MDQFAFKDFDAERAMRLPIGVASPLWLAFSGAAAAGIAFYWMSRWREATNLEAVMALQSKTFEAAVEAAGETLDLAEEAAEILAEEVIEPIVEAMPDPVEAMIVAAMPEPTPAQTSGSAEPDDLTRLTGIGPKLAATLATRGITRFEHIAALAAEDIATLDTEMKLMGRIERDAWVAQAKRFAAGA